MSRLLIALFSEGASSEGVSTIRPEVFRLNKKFDALSQSTQGIDGIRAEIATINKKIDDLNQTNDCTIFLSKINTLKKRIETIEAQL
jgi:septal ring factor EnvC (AmiA/AmiB activator)